VRRVEDLIPLPGKTAQQAEKMSLRMRAEIELGLLDQEDEAAEVGREQALHPHHELESAVGRRPVMRCEWRREELRDVRGTGSLLPARRASATADSPAGTERAVRRPGSG